MDFSDNRDILTSADVVREFGAFYKDTSRVGQLCLKGKIPHIKVPGVGYRFSRKEIEAHLSRCARCGSAVSKAESKWR